MRDLGYGIAAILIAAIWFISVMTGVIHMLFQR
jgi:hypothetical protein